MATVELFGKKEMFYIFMLMLIAQFYISQNLQIVYLIKINFIGRKLYFNKHDLDQ